MTISRDCCCCDDDLIHSPAPLPADVEPTTHRFTVVAPDKSRIDPAQIHSALSRGNLLTMRVGKGASQYVCTTVAVGSDAEGDLSSRLDKWKEIHGLQSRSQATATSANSFLEVKTWRRALGALRATQEQRYQSMLRALRTRHPDESVLALLRLHDYPPDPWTPPKHGDLCIIWAPKTESGGMSLADRSTTNPYTVNSLLLWASVHGATAQWVLRREAADISSPELLLDPVHRKLFQIGLISRWTSWQSRSSLASTLSSNSDGLFSRLRGTSNLVHALAFSSRRELQPAAVTPTGPGAAAPQTRRLLSPHGQPDGGGQLLSSGTVDIAHLSPPSLSHLDAPAHTPTAFVFCEACGEPNKLCFCAAGKARRHHAGGGSGPGSVRIVAPPPAASSTPPTRAGAFALLRARQHNRARKAWLPRKIFRASRPPPRESLGQVDVPDAGLAAA